MAKFDIKAYQHEVRMIRQRERRQAARLGVPVEHAILPKVRDIKLGNVPTSAARQALRSVQKATAAGQIRPPKMVKPGRASRIPGPGPERPSVDKPQQITIDDLLTKTPPKKVRKPREPWTGERLNRQLDRMIKDGRINGKDKELVKNAVAMWPDLQFVSGKAIRDFIDFIRQRNEKDKGMDFYKLFEWSKAYANLKSVGLKNAAQMISEFDEYMEKNAENLSRAKEIDVTGYSSEEVLKAWDAIYTAKKK